MKLRKALEMEIDTVYKMCEDVKKTYPLWDEGYPIYDNFYESFEEGGLYVLDCGGEIVGSICLETGITNDNYLSLSRFMVKESERHKGYGKFIFQEMEKVVLKRGYEGIEFMVHKDHPFAFKMYESFGYKNMGKIPTPWDDGEIIYYLFSKKLK